MPTYVTLFKLTDQGAKNIQETPRWIENGTKTWEGMGGRVIGFYIVLGEYDFVGIGEAPNDEVMAAFSATLSSQGKVRLMTLKGFTPEEFARILEQAR